MRMGVFVAVGLVLATACGGDAPGVRPETVDVTAPSSAPLDSAADETVAGTEPGTTATTDPTRSVAPLAVVDLDESIAINVATNGTTAPVVAWTETEAVQVARFDVAEMTLGVPVDVSGELAPIGHPIERPAISVGPDDVVHVAFTSFVGSDGTVHYVDLAGDGPTEPIRISGDPRPETNLVHMTADDDTPALAWLENSTLSVALRHDGTPTEIEEVDDLTCDCCNPVPIRLGDRLVVAYRDLARIDDRVIRDVQATFTDDGGTSFATPVQIADDHWFLDACPFSGPTVAAVGDALVVAWSDGRQSRHPDEDGTTIWVDRSADDATTFGTDLAITDDGIHRWPVLAIDGEGTSHLLWETQDRDHGGISYSRSDDGGVTFSSPAILVRNTDESGSRRAPSAVVHGDHLLVTWVDRTGGHLAAFALDDLPR